LHGGHDEADRSFAQTGNQWPETGGDLAATKYSTLTTGVVNLTRELGRNGKEVNKLHYTQTSPPVVGRNLVIVGQSAYSVPMTYRTRAGKQFVVVAVGATTGASLVAFALPCPPLPSLPQCH
jgi:glucose dehydrogenase